MTISFYQNGSDVVAVETGMPEHTIRVGVGSTQIEAVDSLEGTALQSAGNTEVDALNWCAGAGWWTRKDVKDMGSLDSEGKADVDQYVSGWDTVATFVGTFPSGQSSDDPDGACDVEVQIGRSGGGWYLRTKDDAGGNDDCTDTAYDTEDEAREAAEEFAASNNESNDGEDAKDYLARMLEESVGESDDDGEYCVYWATAGDDSGPGERYATREQAEARCKIANKHLHERNPGDLLCGYSVRHIVDDEWVPVEPE
jgi:hypothetical protein